MTTNNNRARKTFRTKEEAEVYAEQAWIARENEGIAAFSLAPDERAEAAAALELLRPHRSGQETSAMSFDKGAKSFNT